jgi:ATP synthase protein I
VGLYLDKWLGTRGIFVAIFTILGVIGGGVTVYRQIMEVFEDSSNEQKKRDNGVR